MNVKRIKLLAITAATGVISTAALATTEGFYTGVQLGQSNLQNSKKSIVINPAPGPNSTKSVTPSNTGVGGRIFAGYQTNEYFGFEMGWTYYTPSKYKVSNYSNNSLCNNPTIKETTLDLMGKGLLPIASSGFGVFGKAGIAIARQTQSGSLTSTSGICGGSNNSSTTSVRPAVAVGASYDFSQNWVADLSYNRVMSGGGMPNADLVALGISYHIVSKQCGQFLC